MDSPVSSRLILLAIAQWIIARDRWGSASQSRTRRRVLHQPAEGSLDNPPLGQGLEPRGRGPFDHLEPDPQRGAVVEHLALVSAVGPDLVTLGWPAASSVSNCLPPAESWSEAAVTRTARTSPRASVIRCRWCPVVFLREEQLRKDQGRRGAVEEEVLPLQRRPEPGGEGHSPERTGHADPFVGTGDPA